MKCPECSQLRSFRDFNPAPWCGSPESPHELCLDCQYRQHAVWAERLNRYFAADVNYRMAQVA